MKDYTILLIEDEKNIADFVEKILRSNDYKVVTASTGGEGLSLIKSRCPDIILLDLGLPDMDVPLLFFLQELLIMIKYLP